MTLITIHPDNPEKRKIQQVVDILKSGGVVIYPTDSVYSFACSITFKRAIEKIAKLKGVKAKNGNFSCHVCA